MSDGLPDASNIRMAAVTCARSERACAICFSYSLIEGAPIRGEYRALSGILVIQKLRPCQRYVRAIVSDGGGYSPSGSQVAAGVVDIIPLHRFVAYAKSAHAAANVSPLFNSTNGMAASPRIIVRCHSP